MARKEKRTCSGPVANDGFIYYSYDLLSYDDDEDDDDKMRPEDAAECVLVTTNGDRTARVRCCFNVLAFDPFRIMVPQPMLAGMPLISNSSNMQRPCR